MAALVLHGRLQSRVAQGQHLSGSPRTIRSRARRSVSRSGDAVSAVMEYPNGQLQPLHAPARPVQAQFG